MKRLTTNFCGIELKSPIIIGSSGLTSSVQRIKTYEALGAGGLITKLIVRKHPAYNFQMRAVVESNLGWHATGDKRLLFDEGVRLIKSAKKEVKIPIIANIMGVGTDSESWSKLACDLEKAGADMIELNLSCPNVGITFEHQDGSKLAGALAMQDYQSLQNIVRETCESVNIPVIAKLSSDVSDFGLISQACINNGVSAITAINASLGLAGVDIYNGGRPLYPGMDKQPFVSYFGAWLRPRTYRCIAQIAMQSDIDISASGGIMEWRHVIESIMLGASSAQLCSSIFLYGSKVIKEILQKIEAYMDEMGIDSLSTIKRSALAYIAPSDRITYVNLPASIDETKCIGCGICLRIGHCDAIQLINNCAVVDQMKCIGCGVCKGVCPKGAIYFSSV